MSTLGSGCLDVGDDVGADERVLAVAIGGSGRHRQGELGDRGAGLFVVLMVLALAPDEGVEPHHYDRGANHTATRGTGKGKESISNYWR